MVGSVAAAFARSVDTSIRWCSPAPTRTTNSRSWSAAGTSGLPVMREAMFGADTLTETADTMSVSVRRAASNSANSPTDSCPAISPLTCATVNPLMVTVTAFPTRAAVTFAPRKISSSTSAADADPCPDSRMVDSSSTVIPGTSIDTERPS